MAKFRPRVKGKGKRWAKGQSSSSNPSCTKYRDAAKSNLFQENLGGSLLTGDALQKHNAFFGSNKTEEMEVATPVEEDRASSVTATTYKTYDTFATDFSGCTNVSFSKLINSFNPDSAIQKEKLAILAAVAEVIKSNGGTENNTEYFCSLMAMLENGELEEMSVAALLSLLAMGIKGVPEAVLQLRFSHCAKIFLAVLAKYSDSLNNVIFRGVLSCLSVLLRSQEISIWKDSSTIKVFDSILMFTVHSKAKVRKAAQHSVCTLLRASRVNLENENKYIQHPAASIVADFCIHQIEKNGTLCNSSTTTLHILNLLKDVMMTFPKKHLKNVCETILKVMTLGNVLVLSCSMQTLHGLFVSRPSLSALPSDLNARLITALYDYQPQATDSQPTQAWLAVMQEATINLSKSNLALCMSNLPRFLVAAEALWLTEKPEVINAATLAIKACLEDCLSAAANFQVVKLHMPQIAKVVELLKLGLNYQYHCVWVHVLHLIGVLFKAIGKTCGDMLIPLLKQLAELRDSYKFSYMNELEYSIGNAVRSMGPEMVLAAIPLQINFDASYEFKRSWLLPVLRENIHESTLKCFTDKLLPLAIKSRKKSEELSAKNDKVRSVSYDLLQQQIWALLPSFCTRPSDITASFPEMAKALGNFLSSRKDLKITVMSSLRKLISWSLESDNSQDTKQLSRFAKNYLPILFNIYTTQANGSEEEGIRLAALETITVYITISDEQLIKELFEKAKNKFLYAESADSFIKHSVLDILRVLVPFQSVQSICKFYDLTVANLDLVEDHKEQKKYYRVLEEICSCKTESCKGFLNERITSIQQLLLNSLSQSAPTSKGPRLRCLINLIENYPNLTEQFINEMVPEAVLSCCDINSRCRASAYELLVIMANKMAEHNKFLSFLEIVMAGLAGTPRVSRATILALASITYHHKELISQEVIAILLDNIFLLLSSSSREIVGSALSYIKLYISAFGQDNIALNLAKIMKAIISMTDDCKRHFRVKTRDILSRLVRWYGAENLMAMIPESDNVMRTRIRNLRKIEDRKKKLRESALELKKSKPEDLGFSVKKGPKSIDDILAESESDIDMDEEVKHPKNKSSKKKKAESWIREDDDDDFMDFTKPSAYKKISATCPDSEKGLGFDLMKNNKTKKEKDGGFKSAPDGRLIIKDSDNDLDDEQKAKKFLIPGLSDSDNDYEDELDDDDDATFADKKTISTKFSKNSGITKKRKYSASESSTRPAMKYQAGGSGIHRPIGNSKFMKKKKQNSKQNVGTTGAEYRSKKAGGDVKRKGLPDPYAYLPLQKNMLNRRKTMKAAGQFKTIVNRAKKGAKIGRINKHKTKKMM